MNIFAIESSCDETAAAIMHDDQLLTNVVVSQIDIFKTYGGVIPEIAARSHLEAILPVIDQAFASTGFKTAAGQNDWTKIDALAVTHTPGLLGSLLIGTLTARTLAILHHKPLYAVHHLKSHIYSNWLKTEKTPEFPLLALVISGGHTQIIRMTRHNHFDIIGTTLDDAVGECFDKIAKILGLPYPGGPSIATAAKTGNPKKYSFPHPKTENPLDFSFSGLKTAVLRTVQKECGVGLDYPSHGLKNLLTPEQIADFATSFQATAIDILLEKLQLAQKKYPDTKSLVFAGGVSANNLLRERAILAFSSHCAGYGQAIAAEPRNDGREDSGDEKPKLSFPPVTFSGDNAAMVAMAAYWEIRSGIKPTDPYSLTLSPRSQIQ
ncbi:tRNA (adenosine(37)-N6)-threonylcarbamoyltransferase complex transferase subunit TsaD [Candidatus Saccharibacteria bacterium]|nr:tRNA (adenosine(37)-N6)-threonylcarbamoyltransferase complex transferase subunit TsaD [Candidatus Saccharibacteria bacterium]